MLQTFWVVVVIAISEFNLLKNYLFPGFAEFNKASLCTINYLQAKQSALRETTWDLNYKTLQIPFLRKKEKEKDNFIIQN